MATISDLPTSALFSPSKARAHQAQVRDWAAVDAWLARKYSSSNNPDLAPRIPAFERNDATLAALLTLATFNDSADELRGHVERVQAAALTGMQANVGTGTVAGEVVSALIEEIEADEGEAGKGLDVMAQLAVALDVPSADVLGLAKEVTGLVGREWELRMSVERAKGLLEVLKGELERMEEVVTGLKDDGFRVRSGMVEQTADWVKGTKMLKAKVAEYDERLGASRESEVDGRVRELQEKMNVLQGLRGRLASLEVQRDAYHDIPAEPRAAQARLNEARAELQKLVLRRDQIFEAMVEQR